MIYGSIVDHARQSLPRSAVKTLAVALLAVLAFVENGPLLLVRRAGARARCGDAFLSRDGDRAFLAGLASFLVAHLVYIALFLCSGGGVRRSQAEPWRAGVAGVDGSVRARHAGAACGGA